MESFLSSLKLFLFVEKLYGALPFQFNISVDSLIDIKISKCVLIWGICVNLTYSLFLACVWILYFEWVDDMNEQVFRIQIFLTFLFAGGSYLSYIVRITRIQGLYEKILKYCVYLNNNDYRKKVCRLVACEILLFFLLNCVFHIFFVQNMFYVPELLDIILASIASAAAQHYPVFVVTLIAFQFCNSVLILESLFDLICVELKSQLRSSKAISLEEGKLKKCELIDEEGNISKLVHLHDELCDICSFLNKCFNINLLISILSAFTEMLLSSYYAATVKIDPTPYICDILYHILSLWLILYSCEALVEKTKEVGILVHDLLAETKNPILEKQLLHFSLKLVHRKIEFTACGLFPLDYSLIYSIAGLAATYLVVLIQFKEAIDAATKSQADLKSVASAAAEAAVAAALEDYDDGITEEPILAE